MNMNSWEFEDLAMELATASVMELMSIYTREDNKYSEACTKLFHEKDERKREILTKECEKLELGRTKVALKLAEKLTKREDILGNRK